MSATREVELVMAALTNPAVGGRPAADMPGAVPMWLTTRLRDAGLTGAFRDGGSVGCVQRVAIPMANGEVVEGENLAGVLLGHGELAHEAVVVVAHYDGQGIEPATGAVRPGADDNASGVAAALAMARLLADPVDGAIDSDLDSQSRRSVVVLLTTGEEVGLLGAAAFVEGVDALAARTPDGAVIGLAPVAVVSLDMVGRLGDGPLGVYGTATRRGWWGGAGEASRRSGVRVARHEGFPGSGDHAVFVGAGWPTVLLHTGNHADRHTPRDTRERVDPAGIAKIAGFAAGLVRQLVVSADLAAPPAPATPGIE
ncbi:MAG: M28 family peptidase [Planctomycetota bacterium]